MPHSTLLACVASPKTQRLSSAPLKGLKDIPVRWTLMGTKTVLPSTA
jgi:hypothetical protein